MGIMSRPLQKTPQIFKKNKVFHDFSIKGIFCIFTSLYPRFRLSRAWQTIDLEEIYRLVSKILNFMACGSVLGRFFVFCKSFVASASKIYRISIELRTKFYRNSIEILTKLYRNSIEILSKFYRNSIEILSPGLELPRRESRNEINFDGFTLDFFMGSS